MSNSLWKAAGATQATFYDKFRPQKLIEQEKEIAQLEQEISRLYRELELLRQRKTSQGES